MKQTEGPSTAYLDERLLDVEQELAIAPFRRLYAAFVPVLIALAFFPLLKDVTDKQADGVVITYRYGTLWQMAGRGESGIADIGIIMFGCLVVLLLLASSSRVGRATLAATAGLAILGTILLFARPGTADPTPGLAPAGSAAIAVLYCIAVVTIIQASRSRLWQR
ncbi:MAG TPA: hypothetical protein VHC49_03300 [Mycobacteriales bacterium]|nr:hypothetical protein [Mycobacteriales bacterium]